MPARLSCLNTTQVRHVVRLALHAITVTVHGTRSISPMVVGFVTKPIIHVDFLPCTSAKAHNVVSHIPKASALTPGVPKPSARGSGTVQRQHTL